MKNKSSYEDNRNIADIDFAKLRVLFFALLVGLFVGLVCSYFRILLNYIEVFRESLFADAGKYDFISWIKPILFAITGVSISLFLIRKYAPEASGSGVHEIEGALDGLRPMRWKRVLPIKFFASLFSLGSGLLLGREGPTIQLGANIGKMFKDVFGLSDNENNLLISTGAAAGLSSAFNAPFSGIIFVIEEMHGHFKFTFFSLAAIMIGAGAADFVVRAITGSNPVIQMMVFSSANISELWLFILLGLMFSLIGYFYNKLLVLSLDFFQVSLKVPIIVVGIIAGSVIALMGIFSPEMIGGGYDTISEVLNNSFSLYFLLILFALRFILSIFSYTTGVSGGIFAPLLTLGLTMGMFFGILMHHYFPNLISHPAVFAIAGMAGIFSSTVRAPLTGMALAIEMTSNYELILPLIVTTVTASVFTALFGNRPIYTTLLKRTLVNAKNEKST